MALTLRMATSGMCQRVHRYIEKVGGAGESYEDLTDSLPDDDCCYPIFNFDFVTVAQDLLSLPERRRQ
ncbi:unnamed protein product [Linum tenue]|uniref:Uncharacterized protein n=1 Tax=Linum tenue TaxID=586396 RepID=A0AAV0KUQ1_9ROSI|nr:unnamed protein product [Linum tenue]